MKSVISIKSTTVMRSTVLYMQIKADMESELSLTKSNLGWLDTSLLLPYAVMQVMLSFWQCHNAGNVVILAVS